MVKQYVVNVGKRMKISPQINAEKYVNVQIVVKNTLCISEYAKLLRREKVMTKTYQKHFFPWCT